MGNSAGSDMAWRTAVVLGGARSGKTRHALALAEAAAPARAYVATAEAWDDEMAERIRRHQDERDATWTTHEAPLDLVAAIATITAAADGTVAIVVDCLTLWISNLMHHGGDVDDVTARLVHASLQFAAADHPHRLIFVSNEVGLGIVPENAMARAFRDHQGRVNQAVAAAADRAIFIVAGLPLILK